MSVFFVKTLQNELLISKRLVKIIVKNLCGEGPIQRLLEPTSDSQTEDKMVLGGLRQDIQVPPK
jgi:hypothetical protein